MVPLAYGDIEPGKAPSFAATAAFGTVAEQVGLDSIWVFDHLIFRAPEDPNEPDEGLNECWTTLSALAPIIPRVELGVLVMCSSFRNAGLLAKMAGTLDEISQGRLILGLGCGWHEPEYEAFGFPFDHRVGRFEEDLEVTTRLLRGEVVSLDGKWSQYKRAELLPKPDRQPPILVASKGDRMLELTAKWADAWNTAWFGPIDDTVRQRVADLDAACVKVGRDPKSIRKTIGIRLHEPGEGADDPRATNADAQGLADLFDDYEGLGFSDAIFWCSAKTDAALHRIGEARRLHVARSASRR
jgi:FMNH2-dependent dimethyl sulfone monooxygenase